MALEISCNVLGQYDLHLLSFFLPARHYSQNFVLIYLILTVIMIMPDGWMRKPSYRVMIECA